MLFFAKWHTREIYSPILTIVNRGRANELQREMAIGNTFGATSLSSYGGFWISIAIILTPGGFEIVDSYTNSEEFQHAFALFLFVNVPNPLKSDLITNELCLTGMVHFHYPPGIMLAVIINRILLHIHHA
jgi:hypothetical protein